MTVPLLPLPCHQQAGSAALLDLKTEAQDVVTLDNYAQPVDRGPSAAEAQRMLRSWQYAATGKHSAAAAALMELKAEHIKHGELLYIT